MSWNLDAGRGDLHGLLADITSGRVTGQPPRNYVLLLQETSDVSDLGLSTVFAPVREARGDVRGNAIASTLALHDARTIRLPRERQPRTAAVASVIVAQQPLLLVSVHLENRVTWWRGGVLSENARGRQAAALLAELPRDAHGVLGGDLNTWLGPAEPAWRALSARFPDLPPQRSETSFHDRLALDHILFDVPDGWHVTRQIMQDDYGSNHHPVVGAIFAPGASSSYRLVR